MNYRLLGGVAALPLLMACSSAGDPSDEASDEDVVETTGPADGVLGAEVSAEGAGASEGKTVLARLQGSFDGENFHITQVDPYTGEGSEQVASEESEIGVSRQAVLDFTQSKGFGTGVDGTGTDFIALEQQERVVVGGASAVGTWPASGCGTAPAFGVCFRIRARNLFTAFDISRAYLEFTSVTPTNATTSVSLVAPGTGVDTAVPDFGMAGVGLIRYGLVGFNSPLDNGPERWWPFAGATSDGSSLTFRWEAFLYGKLQRPTVRANLANATLDAPPYYGSDGNPGGVEPSGIATSADGNYVVFASDATNLVASASTAGHTRIYRKNLTTGETLMVSRRSNGAVPTSPAGCDSTNPSVSADGRYVVFQSNCNISDGFTLPQMTQVYMRDTTSASTSLISHANGSFVTGADAPVTQPRIAAGGNFVVFRTAASNVLPVADRPAGRTFLDLYRWQRSTNTNRRANVPAGQNPNLGTATWPNASQNSPDISTDGANIVFDSISRTLIAGSSGNNQEVYFYPMTQSLAASSSSMRRMSETNGGAEIGNQSVCHIPNISANGSLIGMRCQINDGNAVLVSSPGTTEGRWHYYIRSSAAGAANTIQMIDVSPDGSTEASAGVDDVQGVFSPTGRFVAFSSDASNLMRSSGCTPACLTSTVEQIYVYDRLATDPDLRRSHALSLIRRSGAGTPSQVGAFATFVDQRFAMAGPADDDLYIAYPNRSGNPHWGQMPLSGETQIFVSPVGDPLFE